MASEEWVTAAMNDTAEVAEILLRFKHPQTGVPAAVIPSRWGRRLPRSRPSLPSPVATAVVKKDGEASSRCSPTTPLSWSGVGGGGATSPDEDTSSFSLSPNRSEGVVVSETTSTITKKSRKKKTYVELKEEESSLLEERIHLSKELATLRVTLEDRSARNESLKRMKFDLNAEASKYSSVAAKDQANTNVGHAERKERASSNCMPSTLQKPTKVEDNPEVDACETNDAVSNHDRPVFLFDLNVMPPEE